MFDICGHLDVSCFSTVGETERLLSLRRLKWLCRQIKKITKKGTEKFLFSFLSLIKQPPRGTIGRSPCVLNTSSASQSPRRLRPSTIAGCISTDSLRNGFRSLCGNGGCPGCTTCRQRLYQPERAFLLLTRVGNVGCCRYLSAKTGCKRSPFRFVYLSATRQPTLANPIFSSFSSRISYYIWYFDQDFLR